MLEVLFGALAIFVVFYYLIFGYLNYRKFLQTKATFNEKFIYKIKTLQLLHFSNIVAILFLFLALISADIYSVWVGCVIMLFVFISYFLSRELFVQG